ncbi:MAG: hypothetical protein ACE5EH_01955 [Gammaproteobacteria bacterium]
MKIVSRTFVVIMLGWLLTACGTPVEDIEAQKIAASYFEAIKSKNFDRAASFYPPEQQEKWQAYLTEAHDKLGDLSSYNIHGIEPSTVYSGKRFIMDVATKYGDQIAAEVVILFAHVKTGKILLESHKISAKGFRK